MVESEVGFRVPCYQTNSNVQGTCCGEAPHGCHVIYLPPNIYPPEHYIRLSMDGTASRLQVVCKSFASEKVAPTNIRR